MHSNTSPADVQPSPFVSALADIPTTMPAFPRAHAILSKAYDAGFRWKKAEQAVNKIGDELAELKEAVRKKDKENTIEETGDVLSAIVTLTVFQKMDASVLANIPAVPAQSGGTELMAAIDESLANVGVAVNGGQEEQAKQAISRLLADIAAFAASQGMDYEKALQRTNDKFTYRFQSVEKELHDAGRTMEQCGLGELITRWNKYKLVPEYLTQR